MARNKGGDDDARRRVSRAQVQLHWTYNMREAVHLILSEFQLTAHMIEDVFYTLYEEHIISCGFTAPVPANRLSAQWAERKKGRPHWKKICAGPRSAAEESARQTLRGRIHDIVRQLESSNQSVTIQSHAKEPSSPPAAPPQHGSTPSTPSPLSKKAPIAHWAPETPEPETPDHEKNQSAFPQRLQPFRIASAVEVPFIPRQTEAVMSKRRSKQPVSTSPRTPRRTQPKHLRLRPDGSTIMSRQRAYNVTLHPDLVPEHEAHPPLSGLLFRYWNEDPDSKMNSRQGFIARKWYGSNVVWNVVPKSTCMDMTDIFNHLDRKMDKSPFISTSNRLLWIVQLMLKQIEKGDRHGRISVINTAALDKRAVFWARPFHDRIIKTEAFSNGAQRYRGTYEFLCWRDIPPQAMIHTFRASDLVDLATTDQSIATALHFNIMNLAHPSLSRKIPLMKEQNTRLTTDITTAIARLSLFFGLTVHSPAEQISHIVSDVIEGFAIKVEYRDEEQWQSLAALFAEKLCKTTTPWRPDSIKEREKVKLAFLDGVAWGCGKVNARFKPETIAHKQRAAAAVGLASPAKILTAPLDAAKLALVSFEMLQHRRLEAYHKTSIADKAPDDVEGNVEDNVQIALPFHLPTPSTGGVAVGTAGRTVPGGREDDVSVEDESDEDDDYVICFDDEELVF